MPGGLPLHWEKALAAEQLLDMTGSAIAETLEGGLEQPLNKLAAGAVRLAACRSVNSALLGQGRGLWTTIVFH